MAFRNLNVSSGGRRILGTMFNGVLAERIITDTATGDNGPGILFNEASAPANAGKRLRARITNWPSVGFLRVEENGAFELSGLPDGSHTFGYDLDIDGVFDSSTSFSIAVGITNGTAIGAPHVLSLTPPVGAAAGTAAALHADATGTIAPVSFVAPVGAGGWLPAPVVATATGAIRALSLLAPRAGASGTINRQDGSAGGIPTAITFWSPDGEATGTWSKGIIQHTKTGSLTRDLI